MQIAYDQRTGTVRLLPMLLWPDPNDSRYVAIHEAAHAVASIVCDVPLIEVGIVVSHLSNGRVSTGYTNNGPIPIPAIGETLSQDVAISRMMIIHSGIIAETFVHKGIAIDDEAFTEDRAQARRFALWACCPCGDSNGGGYSAQDMENCSHQIVSLWDESMSRAGPLVKDNLGSIVDVANRLIFRKKLTGDEVRSTIRRWRKR